MDTFRLRPVPALATDAEISGLFRVLEQMSGADPIYRQRYECPCGFHGTRELATPPSHIRCPRCDGVAGARGVSERVS